ncbi:UDP-galactose transporter, partial [Ceratobasidium sp. 395]
MALVRLAVCVVGVYAMFLIWGIAQERRGKPERFRSVLLMNTTQSAASAISALLYMLVTRKSGQTLFQTLGLGAKSAPAHANGTANGAPKQNGTAKPNGVAKHNTPVAPTTSVLLGRFLQCAVLITCASPFGFAALSHISYPTMVLGKSCKLVPVMLMNVVLYRRKFAPY